MSSLAVKTYSIEHLEHTRAQPGTTRGSGRGPRHTQSTPCTGRSSAY